jgi:hypothetical protein
MPLRAGIWTQRSKSVCKLTPPPEVFDQKLRVLHNCQLLN